MTTTSPREIPFNGVLHRFGGEKPLDELLSALLADVGENPLPINDIPAKPQSREAQLNAASCFDV
jgi:hypothetical protein